MRSRHVCTNRTDELLAGAWRIDVNGWTFVHVQGEPYSIGFQNGHLLAYEISNTIQAYRAYVEGAYKRDWKFFSDASMNLYWPKLLEEYRTEIEGVADGVKAAGVTEVSMQDIVTLNGFDDTVSYHYWLRNKERQSPTPVGREEHCSAFIATGKTTSDGKIVMAHNTWSSYMTTRCNVIIDLSPVSGNGFVMQANPGSISSGTDWFLTKAGLLVTETTISGVTTFNPDGTPSFMRSRKAAQYADTIDDWLKTMVKENNGGYANDWLVGDMKTNEVAWLELGTFNHAIDRTFDGVFVGSNVATNDQVRSETKFNYDDRSGSCTARHQRWIQLIEANRTHVNVELAKKFLSDHHDAHSGEDTPNRNTLCGHVDLDPRGVPEWEAGPYYPTGAHDGKVTDGNLALEGAFWAHWGKPCDTDFNAGSFLSQHPEYSWQQPHLRDIKAYPWTLFRTTSKWEND